MKISRRSLFKSSGVAAGSLALGPAGTLAKEAVAASPALRARHGGGVTTLERTLKRGKPNKKGWRALVAKPGQRHVVRDGLGVPGQPGRATRRSPLVSFVQMTDVHVVDAQSPARLEAGEAVSGSASRPQETMAAHVAEAMVRELNEIGAGPVTGRPFDLAIQTGDNSDNSQWNEIRWNIDVLDGEVVTPDSGDPSRYEGVQDDDPAFYDEVFWHPHGTPEGLRKDLYRRKYGFPTVPGLLDKVRQPFQATGLAFPWYAAFGNHDQLAQGNFPHPAANLRSPTGTLKNTSKGIRTVTADPNRRFVSRSEWVAEHFTTSGLPEGHGFTQSNLDADTGYYYFDEGSVRFVAMDTVNEHGGDDGSMGQTQFTWLKDLLVATTDKVVILYSHHASWTMDNDRVGPDGEPGPRVLGEELVAELLKHDHVIAWVNGHTHDNNVRAHVRDGGGGGFWEINTVSHIDWPQQSRVIEVVDNEDGTLSIFTTMVDHAAKLKMPKEFDTPVQLAALSRLLAANDPGVARENGTRGPGQSAGRKKDRNVELLVAAPAFMA